MSELISFCLITSCSGTDSQPFLCLCPFQQSCASFRSHDFQISLCPCDDQHVLCVFYDSPKCLYTPSSSRPTVQAELSKPSSPWKTSSSHLCCILSYFVTTLTALNMLLRHKLPTKNRHKRKLLIIVCIYICK